MHALPRAGIATLTRSAIFKLGHYLPAPEGEAPHGRRGRMRQRGRGPSPTSGRSGQQRLMMLACSRLVQGDEVDPKKEYSQQGPSHFAGLPTTSPLPAQAVDAPGRLVQRFFFLQGS